MKHDVPHPQSANKTIEKFSFQRAIYIALLYAPDCPMHRNLNRGYYVLQHIYPINENLVYSVKKVYDYLDGKGV